MRGKCFTVHGNSKASRIIYHFDCDCNINEGGRPTHNSECERRASERERRMRPVVVGRLDAADNARSDWVDLSAVDHPSIQISSAAAAAHCDRRIWSIFQSNILNKPDAEFFFSEKAFPCTHTMSPFFFFARASHAAINIARCLSLNTCEHDDEPLFPPIHLAPCAP